MSSSKLIVPSVILPTCDRSHTLRTAMISALAALPDDGELILVDDGIEFDATSVLDDLVDPRLRLIKTSGRQGPSSARNIGAKAAKGDVLFFLDDDDAMVKDYVRRILAGLKSGQINADFGFSAMRVGNRIRGKSRPTGSVGPVEPLGDRLCGLGMGFWILRSKFEDLGGLDETYFVNEDTEFCLRLASKQETAWFDAVAGVVIRPTGDAEDGFSATSTRSRCERSHTFVKLLEVYADVFADFQTERRKFALRAIKYGSLDRSSFATYQLAQRLLPGESRPELIWHVMRLSLSERLGAMLQRKKRSNPSIQFAART